MKNTTLIFTLLFCLLSPMLYAQKLYQASECNFNFSLGMVKESGGQEVKTILRFAPVVNLGHQIHFDFTRNLGIYTALELKNVGLILKDSIVHKHRAYATGLSAALKLGVIDKELYIFAGGAYDYLFGYKEKLYYGNKKIKRKDYYVNDVNQFQPSVFAGLNLNGLTFRVQYYFNNFFSGGYRFSPRDGFSYQPYSSSHVILFMVGFKRNISKGDRKKEVMAPKTIES